MTENPDQLFTKEDVSKHNQPDDCWIIIEDNVYDVTKFLDDHPGGRDILLECAGTDCTTDFRDVGHSVDARNYLIKYKIGVLVL